MDPIGFFLLSAGTSQLNNDSVERDLHNIYNRQAADVSDLKALS